MFFDEAHLLFDQAPQVLVDKIEQVVRLIRSKGVGVYFISQSPLDIPESVLGQLGLKIQHALRAFTPKDQKAVKVVAGTFRPNADIDTESAITNRSLGKERRPIDWQPDRPADNTRCARLAIRWQAIDLFDVQWGESIAQGASV